MDLGLGKNTARHNGRRGEIVSLDIWFEFETTNTTLYCAYGAL